MALSEIAIQGYGAVSPAGWGVASFREALARAEPLPAKDLVRPGWTRPLRIRQVPSPNPRHAFMTHARLRRTSPIAQYSVAAALEALGDHASKYACGARLGIVFCAMCGCVNYSRRFYDEVLKEPATASPLVFPETVFNAPASHLAALLGTTAINYTLIGDPGIFLNGLALAADWLASERVDGCLVIGAEEIDWLTADAMRLFEKDTILSDGAGAIYLRRGINSASSIRLGAITSPQLFTTNQPRVQAARRAREEITLGAPPSWPQLSGNPGTPLAAHAGDSILLCDGLKGIDRADRDEHRAWSDWNGARSSPKKILGEGLMAASAWQCVAALDALAQKQYAAANVSIVGCNQQAIAAQFIRSSKES